MSLSAYLGIALLAALMVAGAGWKRAISVQQQFDDFKAELVSQAKKQKIANDAEKAKHDSDIKTALADRDSARRLLDAQRASANRVSVAPAATEGTNKLCFSRSQLDDAIRVFASNVQGLVGEGDAAIIDNRAWAEAWPR